MKYIYVKEICFISLFINIKYEYKAVKYFEENL